MDDLKYKLNTLIDLCKKTQTTGETFKYPVLAFNRITELEQRLAAAEAKNTELEKELFILASDVVYCGCGHVSAGLQEKAKRIYGKLRESGGER